MAILTVPIKERLKFNKSKFNLFLDIALALAFVLVLEVHFTGQNLHELIGVGFGLALIIHLLMHWRWVVSITRTFFKNLFHETRLNYVLNLTLFADLLVVIITGIAISRTLGLSLGLERELSHSLEEIHVLASSFSLMLVGLHVAIHWKWIASHTRQYLFRNPFRRSAKPVTASIAMSKQAQSLGGLS